MPRFLSAQTKNWTDVNSQPDDIGSRAFADFARQILLSENLLILCGLGSSLCVTTGGKRLAPMMTDLWAAAERLCGDQFDSLKATVRYVRPASGRDDIELLMSQCQLSQRFSPNPVIEEFITATEANIVERCGFVGPEADLSTHEAFLRKVARRSTRLPRVKVFTTNYDLCFEHAAARSRFVVIDGFSHTQQQHFDGGYYTYDVVRRDREHDAPEYIPNVFHLYKLHGSLDWQRDGSEIVKATKPAKPLIIYLGESKFQSSYDQPFLEMMSRFQMALREPNTALLVCGFGFNDQHVAEPILAAARSNVSLRIAIVDPAADNIGGAAAELRDWVNAGDTRLGFMQGRFEELVPLLPDVIARSEQEVHEERVRGKAS
jgi:hypothetical protein